MLDKRSIPFLVRNLHCEWELPEIIDAAGSDPPFEQFLNSRIEALEESSSIIESLSLDSESARVVMATDDVLKPLVQFIEHCGYPQSWSRATEADRQSMQKIYNICKGALITTLTSVSGETRNSDVLWNDDSNTNSISWFASKMLDWIFSFAEDIKEGKESREDLVICGTLCIGNLIREG